MENVKFHKHIGTDSPKINAKDLLYLDENVQTYLDSLQYETVSSTPSAAPDGISDQIKIYVNGADFRLYIYDFTNTTWRFVTFT